jgi:hypothetical protein
MNGHQYFHRLNSTKWRHNNQVFKQRLEVLNNMAISQLTKALIVIVPENEDESLLGNSAV